MSTRYWRRSKREHAEDPTNEDRVERAHEALDAYAHGTYLDDLDAQITDLMTDLLHFAASVRLLKDEDDLDRLLHRIKMHFEAER